MLLHSIYQLTSRMGRPNTKWYSKAFTDTGDVVAVTVELEKWEPRYLNLLWQPVNVPSLVNIDTVLAATPTTLLLGPMEDSDDGSTGIRVCRTVYMPPPFVPILLDGKLNWSNPGRGSRGHSLQPTLKLISVQSWNGYDSR